ncbi:MAG: TM2 domain-containing protein [Phycisphaerales bacterium JB063]
MADPNIPGSEKKLVAGILGIVLGSLGVHRFYLGDMVGGILRIVITICTCGIGGWLGIIEGIIYLTKSDQDFVDTYINGDKKWL